MNYSIKSTDRFFYICRSGVILFLTFCARKINCLYCIIQSLGTNEYQEILESTAKCRLLIMLLNTYYNSSRLLARVIFLFLVIGQILLATGSASTFCEDDILLFFLHSLNILEYKVQTTTNHSFRGIFWLCILYTLLEGPHENYGI
jgi:hypothetical protein